MVITVDTNVIYSALYSKSGASHYILQLILKEKIKLAIFTQMYFEYYDVLIRKENLEKPRLKFNEVEDFSDLIALLAQKQYIYYLSSPNSKYMVTSNIRDFKSGELKGFEFKIITPKDFYKLWRSTYE